MITSKRFSNGVFGLLTSINRDAGSGALPLVSLGSFSGSALGAYATGSPTTWTDVTGTSFTVQINRPTLFVYMIEAACSPAGAGSTGYIRGNIVSFDTTFTLYYTAGQGPLEGMTWYFPTTAGALAAGTYTCKLQVANDAGNTLTVNRAFHQFFDLGG